MTRRRFLEDLTDEQRICVLLRCDGWTYRGIAGFLGCSMRAVRLDLELICHAFSGLLDHPFHRVSACQASVVIPKGRSSWAIGRDRRVHVRLRAGGSGWLGQQRRRLPHAHKLHTKQLLPLLPYRASGISLQHHHLRSSAPAMSQNKGHSNT